jgi:DNA repair exonuclease SbcCD ATPase subunit
MSFGNQMSEIDFTIGNTVLITGKNGSGKSIITEALTFVLFGKPFRKVNKSMLVNSINGGKLLVELEFENDGVNYYVRRGIKPNVFEIYNEGELINQDAKVGDYQSMFEEHILGMNYTMFTQLVMLGKATYIPFMRLPAGKRRELIEDLLSLSIFSEMNDIIKEKNKLIVEYQEKYENEIALLKEKRKIKKEYLSSLSSDKKEQILMLNEDVKDNEDKIKELEVRKNKLILDLGKLSEKQTEILDLRKKLKDQLSTQADFFAEIKTGNKHKTFFLNNDVCPTCSQTISDEFKETKVNELTQLIDAVESNVKLVKNEIAELESHIEKQERIEHAIKKLQSEISFIDRSIDTHQKTIDGVFNKIEKINNSNVKHEDIANDILELTKSTEKKFEILTKLKTEKDYYSELLFMLKDSGIKSLIVKKYLPIFNKLINKYLMQMGLFVTFTLDETFNEKILSRHKDLFQYNSFSEGEKLRIDLAIMMAWREISKLKSTKNTNLIFMDETFDSSLDQVGVDAFLDLIPTLENMNIFVISHTPEKLENKFSVQYEVRKVGNFSELRELK